MTKARYTALITAALVCGSTDVPTFAAEVTPADTHLRKIGAVTWHPLKFVGKEVTLSGYMLSREKDYVIFSDEPTGRISSHDLPVSGPGTEALQSHKKYKIQGKFLDSGLVATNGNTYHLELTAAPVP